MAGLRAQSYVVQKCSPVEEIDAELAQDALHSKPFRRAVTAATTPPLNEFPGMQRRARMARNVADYISNLIAFEHDFRAVTRPERQSRSRTRDLSPEPEAAGGQADLSDQMMKTSPAGRNRIFSYPLGEKVVGMAACWFPEGEGPVEVAGLLNMPGVENAGDVLLEHIMTEAGADPTILLEPIADAHDRYVDLGFTHQTTELDQIFHTVVNRSAYEVDKGDSCGKNCENKEAHMVLRPTQVPHLWNFDPHTGWHRVGKPRRYLAKR